MNPRTTYWRRSAAGVGFALVFGWAGSARAASMSDEAFHSILLLLSAVSAGYVITHLALEKLSRRYVVAADVHYVLLGIVLGPVLGIIGKDLTADIRPVLSLGAGALGLLAGLETRSIAARPVSRVWGPAVAILLTTVATVAVLPMIVLHLAGYDLVGEQAWTGALIAATMVAIASDGAGVRAMTQFIGARGSIPAHAAALAGSTKAMAVVGFGLMFALLPTGAELDIRPPVFALEALGLQIAAGVALALLFAASVYRKLEDRVLLAVLVGTIFLASGIARSTGVSTIFVCFVAGFVFSRASRRHVDVTRMLAGIQRPFIIALYFFAGLEWVAGPVWTYALVVPFLVLRWGGRRLGGWFGKRLTSSDVNYAAATKPAGGLTVAFILGLRVLYPDLPGMREIYGALLLAVVLIEFSALRAIRRWLIDVADVPPEGRTRQGDIDLS
jgi:Kef-type K+ transport system membrane component KefB